MSMSDGGCVVVPVERGQSRIYMHHRPAPRTVQRTANGHPHGARPTRPGTSTARDFVVGCQGASGWLGGVLSTGREHWWMCLCRCLLVCRFARPLRLVHLCTVRPRREAESEGEVAER